MFSILSGPYIRGKLNDIKLHSTVTKEWNMIGQLLENMKKTESK